ncbi:hypothetical protein COU80_03480 [Candidatus Peregrinibacteria bacterium CG10_big_fil_rev_8_21_14_0_10_55_24]|nr:MAG: hypothetical protein COU80_03480 [Candidatus Peregrinibacteria bacterium CG10_big_fil_rev_8_21_14_0_10_55_24]
MTVLLSALAFLFLLTLLILIHELGHFTAARLAGVKVEEFGIGLPPKAKSLFRWRETVFTLNWVPFGGFVRLQGENALSQRERKSRGSFGSVSLGWQIVVLVAGVTMNLLLAVVLLTFGFSVGQWIPSFTTIASMEQAVQEGIIDADFGVYIFKVEQGGSAQTAGVPAKSVLFAIDGTALTRAEDVALLQEGKRRVTYTVRTGDDLANEASYVVDLSSEGKSGVEISTFPLRVSAPRHGVILAFNLALREAWVVSAETIAGIGKLFASLVQTGTVPEGIAGFVGIAQLTHASVQAGLMAYLRLVALLSLSLAVLNILPFPALDGGRLLFVLAELVGRRPVNRRFELITNTAGFAFLILMLLLITFNDVLRLFS